MNRDIHLIFEAYRQKRIDEMALRVKGEGDPVQSLVTAIKQGLEERGKNNDTYLFKGLTGEALDNRISELVVPIINDLFPNGTYEGRGIEKDLVKLERDIMEKLAASNPKAKSQYTARILKSFIAAVVDEVESNVESGETIEAATDDIADAVSDATDKSEEGAQTAPSGDTAAATSSDKLTVRIEQLLANGVDDSGILTKYLVDDVVQGIRDSGGLGLKEGEDKRKVEIVLKDLINKQIFEKKGDYVKLGKNFEKFEAGGSDSSTLSDEDVMKQYTGLGTANKTSRQAWGGEGSAMSSYFG
jgi:hypothetical protein